jgi:hypothetical protein
MLDLWTDFMTKLMAASTAFTPTATPPEAAREIRSASLRAWTEFWERMMRTPEFLQSMRQSLAANIELRKQFSDLMGQVQHEFQGVSRQDMDQLMRALRRVEHRISDGIDRIGDRVDELHRRLDALEVRREGDDSNHDEHGRRSGEAASDQPRRRSHKRRSKE